MAGDLLPYFKVFPAETLADERFASWTLDERGAWFSLLLHAWVNGSIPEDPKALARILHVDATAMRALWESIGDRFVNHPDQQGRLTSRRLEMEREEVRSKVDAGRKGAESRWRKDAAPMRPQCDAIRGRNSIQIQSRADTEQSRRDSSEPPAASEPTFPAVALFPCVGTGAKEYAVTEAQIAEWSEAYPGLDVRAEVLKARAWIVANRAKRKTAKGMPTFLVNWLNRSQNRNPQPANRSASGTDPELTAALAEADAFAAGRASLPDVDLFGAAGGDGCSPPLRPTADDVAADGASMSAAIGAVLGHRRTAGKLQDADDVEPRSRLG